MVGNHFQGRVAQIGTTRFTRSGTNQGLEQVDIVIAMAVLQNRCQTLQAHAGINAGRGQGFDGTIGLHVKLHEHVIPDFDVAVAIGIGATGGAASHFFAVVVENFRARAARTCIRHHPEVIGHISATFVIANAHHTLRRQADGFCPNIVGFVIVDIHGCPEFFSGELVDLGQQFPRPYQ